MQRRLVPPESGPPRPGAESLPAGEKRAAGGGGRRAAWGGRWGPQTGLRHPDKTTAGLAVPKGCPAPA